MSVSQIAVTSCGMCDIDMRPVIIYSLTFFVRFDVKYEFFNSPRKLVTLIQSLYSGLVVTGGNSFLMGFTERLNHDLAHKCPPVSFI